MAGGALPNGSLRRPEISHTKGITAHPIKNAQNDVFFSQIYGNFHSKYVIIR
jgi:hypothetical protein